MVRVWTRFNGQLEHLYKLGVWKTAESWPILKFKVISIKPYCIHKHKYYCCERVICSSQYRVLFRVQQHTTLLYLLVLEVQDRTGLILYIRTPPIKPDTTRIPGLAKICFFKTNHWVSQNVRSLDNYGFRYSMYRKIATVETLHCTEGCMGEQASLGFDMTFADVLLHKLVQAY